MPRKKSTIRQGNPHMDAHQKVLDSAWQRKLGKALEAMDKPRSLAAGFWKKSRVNVPLKKKTIKR